MKQLTFPIALALILGTASGCSKLQTKPERKYTRGPAGLATTGSFITLESSDGMTFTKWTVDSASAEAAKMEMTTRLKTAVRTVSEENVFDKNGEQIGKKVIALVPPNGADYAAAMLIWTEREVLYEVDSNTLGNILEYRKDFKH